jgi:hypothetical protein
MHLQLFVDMLHVERNGVRGYPDFLPGRFIVMSLSQKLQQAYFMRRQIVFRLFLWPEFLKQLDYPPGDFGRSAPRHGRLPANCPAISPAAFSLEGIRWHRRN